MQIVVKQLIYNTLQSLDLSYNNINEKCCYLLSKTNLLHLNLIGNNIKKIGLKYFLSSHIYKLQLPPGYEKIEKKAKHNFRKKRRTFLEKYMCQDVCNLIIKKM